MRQENSILGKPSDISHKLTESESEESKATKLTEPTAAEKTSFHQMRPPVLNLHSSARRKTQSTVLQIQ